MICKSPFDPALRRFQTLVCPFAKDKLPICGVGLRRDWQFFSTKAGEDRLVKPVICAGAEILTSPLMGKITSAFALADPAMSAMMNVAKKIIIHISKKFAKRCLGARVPEKDRLCILTTRYQQILFSPVIPAYNFISP